MFDRKEDRQKQIDAVSKLMEPLRRGDVLPWSKIEEATGLNRNDPVFRHIQSRARRRLLKEREIVTWADAGVGVRLLTHEETATIHMRRRQRRSRRQLSMGVRELRTVDTEHLSMKARQAAQATLMNMLELRREASRALRDLNPEKHKTKTLPRRQLVGAR